MSPLEAARALAVMYPRIMAVLEAAERLVDAEAAVNDRPCSENRWQSLKRAEEALRAAVRGESIIDG